MERLRGFLGRPGACRNIPRDVLHRFRREENHLLSHAGSRRFSQWPGPGWAMVGRWQLARIYRPYGKAGVVVGAVAGEAENSKMICRLPMRPRPGVWELSLPFPCHDSYVPGLAEYPPS